jgi:hypothetical protein
VGPSPPGGGVWPEATCAEGGGSPPPGVEGWCYGQILLVMINFVNVKR